MRATSVFVYPALGSSTGLLDEAPHCQHQREQHRPERPIRHRAGFQPQNLCGGLRRRGACLSIRRWEAAPGCSTRPPSPPSAGARPTCDNQPASRWIPAATSTWRTTSAAAYLSFRRWEEHRVAQRGPQRHHQRSTDRTGQAPVRRHPAGCLADTDRYSNTNCDRDADSDADRKRDGDEDGHADCDCNQDGESDRKRDCNEDRNAEGDRNGDCDANRNCNCHACTGAGQADDQAGVVEVRHGNGRKSRGTQVCHRDQPQKAARRSPVLRCRWRGLAERAIRSA